MWKKVISAQTKLPFKLSFDEFVSQKYDQNVLNSLIQHQKVIISNVSGYNIQQDKLMEEKEKIINQQYQILDQVPLQGFNFDHGKISYYHNDLTDKHLSNDKNGLEQSQVQADTENFSILKPNRFTDVLNFIAQQISKLIDENCKDSNLSQKISPSQSFQLLRTVIQQHSVQDPCLPEQELQEMSHFIIKTRILFNDKSLRVQLNDITVHINSDKQLSASSALNNGLNDSIFDTIKSQQKPFNSTGSIQQILYILPSSDEFLKSEVYQNFMKKYSEKLQTLQQNTLYDQYSLQYWGKEIKIERYRRIPTTMKLASDLKFAELKENVIYAFNADQQTQGVGVAKNSKWVSPYGNIYVTFAIKISKELAKKSFHFPQIAAAAVAQTIESRYDIEVQMKFVNDVFINDKKVCGVLCQMESIGDSYKLIIGIGVNLNTDQSHYKDLKIATSLLIETGKKDNLQYFLDCLSCNIAKNLIILDEEGFQGEIHQFIEKRMYLLGQKVYIFDKDLVNVTLEGEFVQFNKDGTVKIRDNNGVDHDINDGRMRKYGFIP